ncbi:hypothetical protein [Microcystis aeruginosa]|uniref:hypothetical protein n=1 Tax=Microcystis aeruginosa TaxID=1126 RepID=UPI0002E45291|nr:hypothetical protein [Microcystis aeruginosa]
MEKWLTPSLIVVITLFLSASMTLLTKGQTTWDKLAIDSITFYFVYMRGKNDKQQ